jgi:predicted RNA-binding Zn-ribbon protein involved in translation (DUF1610 family)
MSSMLTMVLRCHSCREEFAGGVSVRRYVVRGGVFGAVIYECPHCGTREPYIASEHRLQDWRGFAWIPRPAPRPTGPTPSALPAYR